VSPDRPPLRGTPIKDYMPDDLGADAYAAVARVFDENRADRARRLLDERGAG
jgi:hypothetical protein